MILKLLLLSKRPIKAKISKNMKLFALPKGEITADKQCDANRIITMISDTLWQISP
jgi:hypothetical protein